MIPAHSKFGHRNEDAFRKIGDLTRKKAAHVQSTSKTTSSIFFLSKEVKSTETQIVNNSQQPGNEYRRASALVSPTEILNTDLAPIGDDIEPIETPREDVEMGNDEDEEPLNAEVPRARMNPKNPTSRETQEHEDSGRAVHRNCLCRRSRSWWTTLN